MLVNTDLLAAGEDPILGVFLREGGDGSMPAVRWYQPVANANGLNQIVELFRRFAMKQLHCQATRTANKVSR